MKQVSYFTKKSNPSYKLIKWNVSHISIQRWSVIDTQPKVVSIILLFLQCRYNIVLYMYLFEGHLAVVDFTNGAWLNNIHSFAEVHPILKCLMESIRIDVAARPRKRLTSNCCEPFTHLSIQLWVILCRLLQ